MQSSEPSEEKAEVEAGLGREALEETEGKTTDGSLSGIEAKAKTNSIV